MTADADTARLAGVIHEINRVFQASHGDECPSQPWMCEDPEIQWVTIRGVHRALNWKGITPQQHHEGWRADKRSLGWRYGPSKDPLLRTHPCMVPYERLPECQQAKDRVFLAIVRELTGGAA